MSQDALDLARENLEKMKDESISKKENSVKTPFLKGRYATDGISSNRVSQDILGDVTE
jgi:hypothetical protein